MQVPGDKLDCLFILEFFAIYKNGQAFYRGHLGLTERFSIVPKRKFQVHK